MNQGLQFLRVNGQKTLKQVLLDNNNINRLGLWLMLDLRKEVKDVMEEKGLDSGPGKSSLTIAVQKKAKEHFLQQKAVAGS